MNDEAERKPLLSAGGVGEESVQIIAEGLPPYEEPARLGKCPCTLEEEQGSKLSYGWLKLHGNRA